MSKLPKQNSDNAQRPLPDSGKLPLHNFERVWIDDRSKIEALFRIFCGLYSHDSCGWQKSC